MQEGNLSYWILQSRPLHSCPQFKALNFCRVMGKISIGANIHVSNSRPWQFSREQKLHRELAYKMSLLGSFQRPEELKLSGVIWCTRYPRIKTSWEQTPVVKVSFPVSPNRRTNIGREVYLPFSSVHCSQCSRQLETPHQMWIYLTISSTPCLADWCCRSSAVKKISTL